MAIHHGHPQRLFYEMVTFDSPGCLARIGAGRSRRWLGRERAARLSHQAAPNCKSAVAPKPWCRNYELQTVTTVTSIPALAGFYAPALGPHATHSPLWVSLQARRLSPHSRGAQLHDSGASIRDPGEQCELDLRFNHPANSLQRGVQPPDPALVLSSPRTAGEQQGNYAQDKSRRQYPGSLGQYTG